MAPNTQSGSEQELPRSPTLRRATVRTSPPQEGGWGWMVVLAASIHSGTTGFLSAGSLPLLYIYFTEYYDTNKATGGWICSINMAANHLFGVLIGALVRQYGCRRMALVGSVICGAGVLASLFATSIFHLYITLGFMAGFGGGMSLLSSFIVVQQWFSKRRSLAASLGCLGFSLGPIMGGPFTQWALHTYGHQGALMLIAGVMFQGAWAACTYFEPRQKTSKTNKKQELSQEMMEVKNGNIVVVTNDKKSHTSNGSLHDLKEEEVKMLKAENEQKLEETVFNKKPGRVSMCVHGVTNFLDFSLLKNPMFALYCVSSFCFLFTLGCAVQHIPGRAAHNGLTGPQIALTAVCSSLGALPGRVVFGALGNMERCNRLLLFGAGQFTAGCVLLCTFLFTSFAGIAVHAICYGIGTGCMSLWSTVQVDMLGVARIARSQGLASMAAGLGFLLGVPIGGVIFDTSQNYDLPFFVAGSVMICGGSTAGLIWLLQRRQRRAEKANQQTP